MILRHCSFLLMFFIFLFAMSLQWHLPNLAPAYNKPDKLKDEILNKKNRLQSEKKQLQSLSSKERSVYKDLAEMEDKIANVNEKLKKQSQSLNKSKAKLNELNKNYQRLQKKTQKTRNSLKKTLKSLWPIYLQSKNLNLGNFDSWQEADRHFYWLSHLFKQAEKEFKQLKKNKQDIRTNLEKQKNVQKEISLQLKKIKANQNSYLKNRLEFLNKIQKIRAKRLAKQDQLSSIRQTINQLEHRLKLLQTKDITKLKGHLPWPIKGKKFSSFHLNSDYSKHGLGFSLEDKKEIIAISWGKVVYNDMLRGFGKVVIIYHGHDYYSLYAYLSKTNLRIGQDVEKGEIIGTAGYFPESKGPGLYFELRCGKQSIDPEPWLTKQSS